MVGTADRWLQRSVPGGGSGIVLARAMQPDPDIAAASDDAGAPRRPRRAGAAFARRAALASALLVFFLAVDASALQGEPRGPFEAARLSDEPLTDDPAGAFEILMISAGVALLAAIATCAFLALARLGAVERALERGAAKEREAAEALRAEVAALLAEVKATGEAVRAHASPAGGADADEQLAASIARLEAGIDRVREAIERRAEEPGAPGAADVRADLTRLGDDLRGLVEGARASGESASRDAVDALRGGLSELRDTLLARGGGAAPEPAPGDAPGVVERIQTRLLALGYTDPVVVTPPEDIAAALDAGGDLVVEARRAGAIHKGRVVLEHGAIADVQLRPSHDIFP